MLKIGGHLVSISRLSTSAIFRNLLDSALKTGAGDGNRTRDLLFTKLKPEVSIGFCSPLGLQFHA
jgi:hypothetical protein